MRVNELVKAANEQQEKYKAKTGAGGSQIIRSATGGAGRSAGQASSPHDKQRERSVNSSKNKQLAAYDPAFAGKQIAGHENVAQPQAGHGGPQPRPAGHGGLNQTVLPRRHSAGSGNIPRQAAEAQYPQQHLAEDYHPQYQVPEYGGQYQGGGPRDDRFDDGDSALRRAGYLPEGPLVLLVVCSLISLCLFLLFNSR